MTPARQPGILQRMVQAIFHRFDEHGRPFWLCCQQPAGVVVARTPQEVLPALERVEQAAGEGLYVAGFLAYEAAPGLDASLCTHDRCPVPLAWFGLFRSVVRQRALPPAARGRFAVGPWVASISAEQHRDAVAAIRELIARGDTYQVNYSYRLRASFAGEALALFRQLCQTQPTPYGAYLETGEHTIVSATPELFVERDGPLLVSRPMKGTWPRGLTCEEDARQAAALRDSAKNRAENAMIVDMIRNDMGRVAEFGSVHVRSAFDVETYPTVLQMTSTVAGRSERPLSRILQAMFPCASITGAPKVRTMQIIRELENEPRGIYTGCIGLVEPGGRAVFGVAIRTVTIDVAAGAAEYGVGGGIVWDSADAEEYEECRLKAQVLTVPARSFELLESLRHSEGEGYWLLAEHLERLRQSARHFGFAVDVERAHRRLLTHAAALRGSHKVRLRVGRGGRICVESAPLEALSVPRRLRLAPSPVNCREVLLYHKTTARAVYESARATCQDCDDVVLWNQSGQVTETTQANLVAELDGRLYTPPVECGLLGGVFRQQLLASGQVQQRILSPADLQQASRLWVVNSVRGQLPAVLLE